MSQGFCEDSEWMRNDEGWRGRRKGGNRYLVRGQRSNEDQEEGQEDRRGETGTVEGGSRGGTADQGMDIVTYPAAG